MLFDSHAHYDDERFDEDREELLSSMKENGVGAILNCGADIESSRASIKLAKQYDFIYAAVGVHPSDTKDMQDKDIEILREMAKEEKVVAIGEIGLDYHYDNSPRDIQRFWFEKQLHLAQEIDMPVIIHEREAKQDCLDILKRNPVRGVMHCFSGNAEIAKQVLSMGMYISFAGPLTFKNNVKTVEVAQMVPLDRFLIETDSPYLAPVPMRGKRNDSTYVRFVAEKIAEIRGISPQEVADLACENTKRLFGI